ncbi:MAG: hypothetical protein ACREAC_08320 [Blastocatellia bacterium]
MFKCSHFRELNMIGFVNHEAGDYIVVCPSCGTKNILAPTVINNVLVPRVETLGYRD